MAVLSSVRQWLQTRSKKLQRQGERCQIRPRRRTNVRLQVEQLEVRLTPATLSLLYSFAGGTTDGYQPYSTPLADSSGNLFGTTRSGGTSDNGTVYELVKSGSSYTETLLHSFAGATSDGATPLAGLTADGSGNLFGTTTAGGSAANGGIVFELVKSGTSYTEQLVYQFPVISTDGFNPQSGLIADANGNLFGTTVHGSPTDSGTVFDLLKSGTNYNEGILHFFTGGATDGDDPGRAGLVEDASGNLFGTTVAGGPSGSGSVFEFVKSGSSYTEQILYFFAGGTADGNGPDGGLIVDASGNLFGTTSFGGPSNSGTVFELVKSGSSYTEQILHHFAGGAADGSNPVGGLIEDASGNLFGNTLGGSAGGNGTVYELVKSGSSYTEQILHSFASDLSEGGSPQAGLIEDASGNLFGTTSDGGAHSLGTVFELMATVAAPTVTGINPTSGPVGGGTSVTITGTNLAGATAVNFGTTAATIVSDTATQIVATSPAGTAGQVADVTVTTAGGNSAISAADQFTYVAAPTVTGINPTTGPVGGGTSVTITGTNLAGATAVNFGKTAATIVSDTATQIVATSPAGTAGQVADVTVTTAGGTSATSAADRFAYLLPAPSVTGVNPTPTRPPPFVSVAFGLEQLVLDIVTADGILTQYDALGAHQLATGVRSASVAFGPFGEVMVVVYQNGQLVQYDASGVHLLANGILSAGVGIFAGQEVLEVVAADGTLTQYDAFGAHPLTTGVRSASVAFGLFGEALDLVFADGQLLQLDSSGSHLLGNGVLSAGVAFSPFGEVLDAIFADGSLFQFDAAGIHKLGVLSLV